MSLLHRTKIGRGSIKESFDNLPGGVCFADRLGTIILCNRQMHRLCHALMGMDLQHISELRGALKKPYKNIETVDAEKLIYRFPDGTAWQFSEKEITTADTLTYTGVQAAEVTALLNEEAALEQENKALEETNARAKRLYTALDRIVREEENFAVKTRVHDEMGLLLLSSRNLLTKKDAGLDELQELGKEWRGIAGTLGAAENAAEEAAPCVSDQSLAELIRVIAGVGVTLTVRGELPQDSGSAYLLTVAIRECATNTVRHADGSEMTVELTETGGSVCASITNNGKAPEGEIVEGGGLSSLRRRIENAGGTMTEESTPVFRLTVTLPGKGINR